jgi:hypothetical protein
MTFSNRAELYGRYWYSTSNYLTALMTKCLRPFLNLQQIDMPAQPATIDVYNPLERIHVRRGWLTFPLILEILGMGITEPNPSLGVRSAWRKAAEKTVQRPRCCSKLKQQLCIQNGTRAHYLNYLQKGRARWGKEAQALGLASQSDR